MARKKKSTDDVLDAALNLAAERDWRGITLGDIATATGVTQAELRAIIASKADILKAFIARSDQELLSSLDKEPVEGDIHDRLFDIVMRRLELLDPHKAAIRNIVADPADGAAEWATLANALIDSQGWTLAAAGIDNTGRREGAKRHGLAMLTARTLRVWANDDDPGLARTMASLDRSLRDGAKWLERLDAPFAMVQSFANLALAFIQRQTRDRSRPDEPDAG